MSRAVLSRAAFVGVAVVLASIVAPNNASAQAVSGFAVNRFEPAGADSAWMTADSLRFDGHLKPVFALVDDFAWKPLIVYDAQGHDIAPLVRDQMFAHLDAALLLWNRVRADSELAHCPGERRAGDVARHGDVPAAGRGGPG